MSKIIQFFELLDEGYTRQEARDKVGLADTTSKTQYAKWKKTPSIEEPESNEEMESDEPVTFTEDEE